MFVDSFKKQYLELSPKVKLFESIYNGTFNVHYVTIQNSKVDFCEELFFFIIIQADIYTYIFIYIHVIENSMLITIIPFRCNFTCMREKQIILGASSLNHDAISCPNDIFEYH